MKIAVIGTGYVGLVAGAGFADCGNDVCVDLSEDRVKGLREGKIPFYEPGLSELVQRNVQHERLSFSTSTADAVAGATAVFIAVGTPSGEDGADLSQVREAAAEIGKSLTGWAVIVNKSTVPVGTGKIVKDIVAKETKHDFAVASNPEFLKEGNAVNDFLKPDRIIVGCEDKKAAEILHKIYSPLLRLSDRFRVMDVASAELTVSAVQAANQRQKLVLGEKIRDFFGDKLKGARIAVWGLAFKPETDDIRESPALYAIRDMLEAGAEVVAYDPAAMVNVRAEMGDTITYAKDMYSAADGADALVMVTEWHEFRRPSFVKLKRLLKSPVLFDGRNQWDPEEVAELGFTYQGIGRRVAG